jgi:hypothetical protein
LEAWELSFVAKPSNITFKETIMLKKSAQALAVAGLIVIGSSLCANAAGEDMQQQVDAIKSALPKFAIPMREVGDRFQNIAFAAEGGNWGLAAYMGKYMNGAMNPAKVTKPQEYSDWKSFYEGDFAKVTAAIASEDLASFKKEYDLVIASCNECHVGTGYGFIKVIKLAAPADQGIEYKMVSKAADVPK